MQSETFDEFVRRTTPTMLGRARTLAADPHDAWDLVQETLARIGERWERLEKPEAYATTVMTRLNIDRLRRLRRELGLRRRLAMPEAFSLPAEEPEAWLVAALRTLSPHQRTALALRYLDDLDVNEIADRLRCRPGTARSHLSRGLMRLRAAAPADRWEEVP